MGNLKETRQGFTLLEVVIAAAILAIIGAMAMQIVVSASGHNSYQSITTQLNNWTSDYVSQFDQLLVTANIAYINTTTHATMQYQLPLSYGGSITWGAYDGNNTAQSHWYYQMDFVADKNLNETTGNIDYNADNVLGGQYFQYGHLIQKIFNQAGVQQGGTVIIYNYILLRANSTYTEIDYTMKGSTLTAVGDPLFELMNYQGNETTVSTASPNNPLAIKIDVWFALSNPMPNSANYLLANTGDWITLQNPQNGGLW